VIDEQQRASLAALADVLIPAAEGMPSGAQAGVAERWLDEVISILPEVEGALSVLLASVDVANPSREVARLQTEDPAAFDLVCTVVAGAYFLNPDVRQAIGYPGQQAVPIVPETPPDYEQDGLLASVIARGPVYRPTPGR
jgi:hypothetical protein